MSDSPPPETGPVKAPSWTDGSLAAALARVQADLPSIAKDQTAKVPTKAGGEYSYTYADLASISAAVLPKLAGEGLAFTTWPMTNAGQFVLRYRLMHTSGEEIVGDYPLGPVAQAQAMGSAITYARRYCLCAVVGVAPDDDDDGRQAQAATSVDPELEEARSAVRGAWAFQYGAFNQREAAEGYKAWSKGGSLYHAAPGDLRKFAAYLSNLPKEDAGGDPADATQAEGEPKTMTPRMRGKLFALMGDIGLRSRHEQLEWINKTLGREYESRSLVTFDDASTLIKGLEQGIDAPGSEPA